MYRAGVQGKYAPSDMAIAHSGRSRREIRCTTMTSEITVCIATHRRPEGLQRLLTSLVDQRDSPAFDVIVVDNDAGRSGERVAVQFQDRLGLSYLVEPVRGLARTRNRAVAAARTPFVAFIDDDEWASPEWLAKLAQRANKSGADVVIGPVERIFAEDVPEYIRTCGSFDNVLGADGTIVPWYAARTGNAFIRRDALPDRYAPFSTRFDFTGGEDTNLFRHMIEGGALIVAARDAVVFEHRPLNRANLRWVVRRALRNGGTIAGIEWGRCDWKTKVRRVHTAIEDAMREGGRARTLWKRDRSSAVRHLVRACMEFGKILHSAGIRIEEYRKHQ
jgi:succinoglycan biosynthesis protein ExoM